MRKPSRLLELEEVGCEDRSAEESDFGGGQREQGSRGKEISSALGKRNLRIGEVSELLDVRHHVLRYWESEFPEVAPSKSRQGHRLYSRRDLDILLHVKWLLHEEGYTIAGAKEQLAKKSRPSEGESPAGRQLRRRKGLRRLQGEIEDLLLLLERRESDLEERARARARSR